MASPYYTPDLKLRLCATGGILAVFALMFLVFRLTMTDVMFYKFAGFMVAYTLPGFGKESIVPLAMAFGIAWWQITIGIIIADMTLAIIIAYNFDLLLKIPLLGRLLRYFTAKTNEVLQKYLWIQGLSLVGLFLFMYIPFMGSSAINTTIVGRLLSIRPRVLLTIVFVGSVLATLTMSVGMHVIMELYLMNPVYAVIAVVCIVLGALAVWKLWKRYTEKRFPKNEEE